MTPSKPPTRRRHAAKELRMAQNPHHRRYEARRRDWRSSERVEGPGGGAGSRWRGRGRVGPGTVPGTVAGRQARHNSPSTPSPPLNPRQNSPSNLKNIKFGVFRARRANFFTLTPTIRPCWANFFTRRTPPVATLQPMTPLQPLMQASMKPPSPLRAPEQQLLKPTTPLQPKNALKTPVSHPQRRHRFQPQARTSEQRPRRFQSHAGTNKHRQTGFTQRICDTHT